MKKFISALSSFVIAATAMGGSMAIGSSASINEAVANTVFAFRSEGKDQVEVNAGDTVPVSIHVPASNGFYQFGLKFTINGAKTLGEGKMALAEAGAYSDDTWEHAFGNYGITIDPNSVDWHDGANALESGFGAGLPFAAGIVTMESYTFLTADAFYASYISTADMNKGMNIDSFAAWDAAGKPDYASYTPATTWEGESWAYDNAFVTFDLVLPSDLPDGVYVLDAYYDSYYLNTPSANWKDDGTEKSDADKGKGQSAVIGYDDAGNEAEKTFKSEALTIVVGDADPSVTTTTPAPDGGDDDGTTATTPADTDKPDDGNKPSYSDTDFSDPADVISYKLIPDGKTFGTDYFTNGTRYVYPAQAGEELTINWTVEHDPGTAGIQMFIDFSQIEVTAKAQGAAYMVIPQIQDANINTVIDGDDENSGLFGYVFGGSQELTAADNAVIYTFTVTVPDADGTYTIDLKPETENTVNKVVPATDGETLDYVFHGLDIVVGDVTPDNTTTTTTATTADGGDDDTTTTTTTTTTKPDDGDDDNQGGNDGDIVWGDVNVDGKVKINDVVLLNKYLAKNAEITDQGKLNADCNHSGEPDTGDAVNIKEYLARLRTQPQD